MRILILSKRQYMSLDLINDRYGRFRELPLALAALENKVTGICLSYRPRSEGLVDDIQNDTKVSWHTLNLRRLLSWGAKSYWKTLNTLGRDFRPDLVWACSDAIHAILGVHIANKLNAALVIDLYDNFESYPLTHIPGITAAFRQALRKADGITCVSRPLAEYVLKTTHCSCPIEVIENAVPEKLFHPMDQSISRRKLKLPENDILIGTAGAISRSRGIDSLVGAFEVIAKKRTDIHLVLAGPCDKDIILSSHPRLHYLGVLPQDTVPIFLSSLNINVICNRDSEFGRYCFPQKYFEAVACGVPVVAAATGAILELLKNTPALLFEPDNIDSLVSVLLSQIANPIASSAEIQTWTMLGKRLDKFFLSL